MDTKTQRNIDSGKRISQADKFREAAKEAETDDDEKRFDERFKQIVDNAGKGQKKGS
ncbi:MAG: hypothetical protein H6891_13680 [Brucellaceae bacterium]|nr:hypothetical protein [Brucellaceae bacterium]